MTVTLVALSGTVAAQDPTAAPTAAPTAVPSVAPTAAPQVGVQTAAPTTAVPTHVPTVGPTSIAPTSTAPTTPGPSTAAPTHAPTRVPTVAPTNAPTEAPTAPTAGPTAAPSAAPTSSPTFAGCSAASLATALSASTANGIRPPSGTAGFLRGDRANVDCAPGFTREEFAPFQCTSGDTWSHGRILCRPVSCGSPNAVGSNLITAATCQDTTFQSRCTVSCAPGYTGTVNLQRECQASGQWNGTPQCTPATCASAVVEGASLASLNRSFVQCANRPENGESCVADCRPGFRGVPIQYHCELPSGSSSLAMLHRGSSAPGCEPITCSLASLRGALGTAAGTSTLAATGTGWDDPIGPAAGFAFNAPFVPTCGAGFEAVGQAADAEPFRCVAQDLWSIGRRVCRRVSCGSPEVGIANSEAPVACSTDYNSTCSIQCATGYEPPTGSALTTTRRCQSDRTWSRTSFSCERVQCAAPPLPTGAAFVGGCPAQARRLGGTCTASCAENFQGSPATYICNANGTMTGQIACSAIECSQASLLTLINPDGNPSSGNGTGAVIQGPILSTYGYNASVSAVCAPGFALSGGVAPRPFTCTATNTWSGGRIRCSPLQCDQLSFQFATLNGTAGSRCETRHGSQCVATCNSGFRPVQKAFTCNGGAWAPDTRPPTCGCRAFIATSERAATGAANAQIDRFAVGGCPAVSRGSTCPNLGCEAGFIAEGSLVCSENDVWVGRLRCVPKLALKTGGSRFFEGPSFLEYDAIIDYTSVTNATVPQRLGGVDGATRAWVTEEIPVGEDVGLLRVVASGRLANPEILRLNVTSVGFVNLALSSPDVDTQRLTDRSTQVRRTLNLAQGLSAFVASGGSGRYDFFGNGHQLLPDDARAQFQPVPGTSNQFQLTGLASEIQVGQDFTIFVTVVDRFYGTRHTVSLRFAVVEALSGEVTADIGASTSAPPALEQLTNNIFDTTEDGTFEGTVLAQGVSQQAAAGRQCSLVDIEDVRRVEERTVPCPPLQASVRNAPGQANESLPCLSTCIEADPALARVAPWCFVGSPPNGSLVQPFRYCDEEDSCLLNVTNCSLSAELAADGSFACTPESAPSAWSFGLPGGLSLNESTCLISGTVSGNWPDDTFNSAGAIPPREIRTLVNVSVSHGTAEFEWALVRVIFRVHAPVVVRVVRPNNLIDPNVTENVNVGDPYQARILISGGIEPYNIPAISASLPDGLSVERVFQIRGTPLNETLSGLDVVARSFHFLVTNNYPRSQPQRVELPWRIGLDDCLTSSSGPGGSGCENGGVCNDTVKYDRDFTCTCDTSNFEGDNCETLVLAAASSDNASEGDGNLLVIAAISAIFFVILVAGVAYMSYQRHLLNKPFDFEANMAKMIEDGMLGNLDGERKMPSELKRNKIVMLDKLGSGAFGDVNKGLYNPDIPGVPEFAVAIKVLKESPTREEREELMKEATVSAQFDHENVVMCIGVVTAGQPVMLVLQLCDKGSMHSLLKTADPQVNVDTKGKYCLHVVLGMDYLAGLGFVHRDLAARNVLVDAKDTAKIADFGLSRDTEDNDYYVAKAGKVPIRWTAPEALSARKFSEQSDVWAYAITAIEIFTDADTPYKGWMNAFVLEQVLDG